ncbi:MAG: hypothetical protein ACMUJM_08030 [bacterium]
MVKNSFLPILIGVTLTLILAIPLGSLSDNESEHKESADYRYKLYISRGELSMADNYYETAIKNFQKAISIKSELPHAKDLYEKAVVLKKLGIISEAAEAG